MRKWFILMLMANLAVTLVSLIVLPERVAIHFGTGGVPNGWASNLVNALLMTGTHALLFCLLYFSPRLVVIFPAWCINLPHKEYWLKPGNLPKTQEKLNHFMWQFGAAIFLFFLVVGLLALQANLVDPVRLSLQVIYPVLGLFLLYTIGWLIAFYRAFRLP